MGAKIFISVDMEGVAGVVHRDHTSRDGQDYEMARRLMTLEANAAVEGAFQAGADEVLVSDSHGTMRNLLPELLDQRARLVSGSPKPLAMMAGIDESFDAGMCIGYHGRANTMGVLTHTIAGGTVADFRINGRSTGELGIFSGIAGYYGVPVVLVAGDSTATDQARETIPNVEVATVKEPLTPYSANNLSPTAARSLITEQARIAIERRSEIEPVTYSSPVTMRVKLYHPAMADVAGYIPGVTRVDDATVEYTADDYILAYNCAMAIIMLGGTVR